MSSVARRLSLRLVSVTLLAQLAIAPAALTQTPPTPPGRPAGVLGLILRDLPEFPGGKTSLLQGVVDPSGHRFLIENLDVLQPVSVTLVAAGPDEDLSLRLTKFGFDKPEREGSTLGEGIRQFRIRTQGDLRLQVTSREGQKPYQLIVWVGEPIEVPVPLLFLPAGGRQAAGASPAPSLPGSGSTTALWAALAGLTVVVALLGFLVLRGRSGRKASVLLLAFGMGAVRTAWAQCPPTCEPPPNATVKRIDPAQIWGRNPYAPNGYNPPPGPAGERGWSPTPANTDIPPDPTAGQSAPTIPAGTGTNPLPAGNSPETEATAGSGMSGVLGVGVAALAIIGAVLGFIIVRGRMRKTTIMLIAIGLGTPGPAKAQQTVGGNIGGPSWWGVPGVAYNFIEWYKATYQPLTSDDEGAWPAYDAPAVPTNCATTTTPPVAPGTAAPIGTTGGQSAAYPCGQCFVEAHTDLGTVLQRFEKLRRVTSATENMTRWALAFGDAASGIHGVTALGWHTQARPQITKSMETFYVAYDEKVVELLEALSQALQKVGVCEKDYFGTPDWYERYGFMFFNSVAERHRR